MLYKYGERSREFLGRFHFYFTLVSYTDFEAVLNKTIIPLALDDYSLLGGKPLVGYLTSQLVE